MPLLVRIFTWSPARRILVFLVGRRAGRAVLRRVPKRVVLRTAWRLLRL